MVPLCPAPDKDTRLAEIHRSLSAVGVAGQPSAEIGSGVMAVESYSPQTQATYDSASGTFTTAKGIWSGTFPIADLPKWLELYGSKSPPMTSINCPSDT